MSLQKLQPSPVVTEPRAPVSAKKSLPAGQAPSLPEPRAGSGVTACAGAFMDDLRAMCALIGEADRYGSTSAMEEEYKRLRTALACGYRAVSSHMAVPPGGFHGCGFEMILGPHSLEALVRTTGTRAVERLSEVWQSVCAATAV